MDFHNLIIKIFKSHGFEINSTSNYSKYILATKDNTTLSIGYSEPTDDANVGNLRNFIRTAKKDAADRLIYILPKQYPDNIDRFAEERNIQLWDNDRLEREIGRTVVSDLQRPNSAGDFSNELNGILSTSADTHTEDSSTKPSPGPSIDDEFMPIMVPIVPLMDEVDSTSDSNSTQMDTTLKTEDSSSPLEEIKDYRIVKPVVNKDSASSMANRIVKGFRFNLELIPYYIFDYSCKFDVEEVGSEDETNYGLIAINGLTSNVEDWAENKETVKYLDEPHTKLEVKFPYDKALSIAQQAVVEFNTKMIETKEEFESTIIFEKKKLKPKFEAIDMNTKGIHYLPVWCIEGSNGLMIIDASSGKIIKEDIFRSSSYQDQDSGVQETEM